jgi:hypothetical protein
MKWDPKSGEKPLFLRPRQWEYILVLEKHGGNRMLAAYELGVTVNAVEKMLTLIRNKIESAYAFKRKYRKLIERKR